MWLPCLGWKRRGFYTSLVETSCRKGKVAGRIGQGNPVAGRSGLGGSIGVGYTVKQTKALLDYLGGLTVTQGRLAGLPFHVMPWERRFIKGAFGPGVVEAAL